VLLTAHILYGKVPAERAGEISALSRYITTELRSRSKSSPGQVDNLIVLGDFNLELNSAGVLDFADVIYPEVSAVDLSFRMSDHLPLWAEFALDQSSEQLARALGLEDLPPDPERLNPLDAVSEIKPRRR
jgi:endonuclease/exonuclease/phosphatase family metal-dependent hydrolase